MGHESTTRTERPDSVNVRPVANEDMIEGYMDGYELDAPEPSANRSHSYRHGFSVARAEKTSHEPLASYWELEKRAVAAMQADAQR